MSSEISIQDLAEFDEEDLYELLGAYVLGRGVGFAEEDPARARKFGLAWFRENLPELRARLCNNEKVRAYYDPVGGDSILDVATIADILADMADKPVVLVVAVIISRQGLRRICADL